MASYSDHINLWLDIKGGCLGREEKCYLGLKLCGWRDRECSSIIEKVWSGGDVSSSLSHVMGCISRCASDLKRWNKCLFVHVQRELSSAQLRLKAIQESNPTSQSLLDHKIAREDVQKWLERDEVMWKQRS